MRDSVSAEPFLFLSRETMPEAHQYPSLPRYSANGSWCCSCLLNGIGLSFERFALRDDLSLLKTRGKVARFPTGPAAFPLKPVNCHMGVLLEGKLTVDEPGGASPATKLGPGNWFIYAGSPRELRIETTEDFSLFTIESGGEALAAFLAQADPVRPLLRWATDRAEGASLSLTTGKGNPTLLRFSREVMELGGGALPEQLRLESAALGWLCELLDQAELRTARECDRRCPTGDDMAVLAAARYLEANLEREHRTAELSRRFHLNEFKLKKGFREVLGTSIQSYLRAKRMERAADLLARGELSVMEVAGRVGYDNASHFARAFRRHYGMLPKRFQIERRA